MRQHIRWAKDAGIDGLHRQLEDRRRPSTGGWRSWSDVARNEHFKLAIIYQGLDFEREPLPAARVAHDLRFFARPVRQESRLPHLRQAARDLVGDVAVQRRSTSRRSPRLVRNRLLILARARRTSRGYERLARFVDGDAYYWSSVNPDTYPGYEEKLDGMGEAVHARDGLWIAPAAAGFDARLIGGETVVPRLGGDTLPAEFDAALGSSPDAVGVISWNEFSENSHIEPSVRYGRDYINVLADVGTTIRFSSRSDFDSSSSRAGIGYGLPILSGLFGLIFCALLVSFTRRHITHSQSSEPAETQAGVFNSIRRLFRQGK